MKSRRKRPAPPTGPVSPRRGSEGNRHLAFAAGLCALTLLAYSNSFSAGFVLDNKSLLQDPRIQALTGENLRLILQHTYWWPIAETGLYRPFTTLSYLFNYAVLGDAGQPSGYHCVNLILHAGNVLLVFALGRKLLQKFSSALLIAAVWAVHPVLTEAVTNIVGRADLLAAMATLSGLLLYLKSTDAKGSRLAGWLAGLAAVTAVGAFSKESAVAIPGVIALYEFAWWKERKQMKALALGLAATLAPIALMLIARTRVLAASAPAEFPFTDNPIAGAGFWAGKLTALGVMARYLWLMIWPARLSSDYSYRQISLADGRPQDWIAWTVVFVALFWIFWLWRSRRRTAFFWAGFALLTFLPASNLLFPTGTIMAERLLYLPSVGLVVCLVMAIDYATQRTWQPQKARLLPAILSVVMIAFAIRTWVRNRDWRDDLTMAQASARSSPYSFKTHRLLAAMLFESDPANSNIDAVIGEVEKAVAVLDPLPDSRSNADTYRLAGGYQLLRGDLLDERNTQKNLAVSADAAGSYDRAVQLLLRSIAIGRAAHPPRPDPEAAQMLSAAYLKLGKIAEAGQAAREALHLHPRNADAYRQIAYIFLEQNKPDDAAAALIEGSLIVPDPGLTKDLIELYRKGLDPQGCAMVHGQINPGCAIVRKHFCAAAKDVIEAQLESGHPDLARQQKQSFLKDYGCASETIDKLSP